MHQTAIKQQLTNPSVRPLHPEYKDLTDYFKDDPDISMILCDEFFQTQFIRNTQITDFKLSIQKFDSYIIDLQNSQQENQKRRSSFDNSSLDAESKAVLLKIRREILTSFDLKNYLGIQKREERAQTLQTIQTTFVDDLNKLRFSNVLQIEKKKQKKVRRSRSLIIVNEERQQKYEKEVNLSEQKQLLNANRELQLKLETKQNKFMKIQSEFTEYKQQQGQKLQNQEKLIEQLKTKVKLLQKQIEVPKEKEEEKNQQTYQSDNTLTKLNKGKETLAKMHALNAKEYETLNPEVLASKLIKSKINNMYLKQSVNSLIEEKKQLAEKQDDTQKQEDITIQAQYQQLWMKLIQYNKQFARILSEFKNYENKDMDLLLNDEFVNKIIESKQKVFEMEKQLNEAKEAKIFLSLQLEQKAIENARLRKIIEEEKLLQEQDEIESIDLRTEKTESLIDSKQFFKSQAQQQSLLEKYQKLKPHDQSLEKNEQVCEVCIIF